jgi:hypothetical protein
LERIQKPYRNKQVSSGKVRKLVHLSITVDWETLPGTLILWNPSLPWALLISQKTPGAGISSLGLKKLWQGLRQSLSYVCANHLPPRVSFHTGKTEMTKWLWQLNKKSLALSKHSMSGSFVLF